MSGLATLGDLSPAGTLHTVGSSLAQGEWVPAALSAFALGVEAVGVRSDPLGAAVALGAEWAMEEVAPLRACLDEVAGDADQVRARAAGLATVAATLEEQAEGYRVASTCGWQGQAAEAYTRTRRRLGAMAAGVAVSTRSVAAATDTLATVVQAVRHFVRGLVADVVATATQWGTATLVTGGLAVGGMALVLAKEVVSSTLRARRWIDELVVAVRNLKALLRSLEGELRDLAREARGMVLSTVRDGVGSRRAGLNALQATARAQASAPSDRDGAEARVTDRAGERDR